MPLGSAVMQEASELGTGAGVSSSIPLLLLLHPGDVVSCGPASTPASSSSSSTGCPASAPLSVAMSRSLPSKIMAIAARPYRCSASGSYHCTISSTVREAWVMT